MNVRASAYTTGIWLRRHGSLLLACLVIGMLISLGKGQSNWWDLLNYHIYNPWNLLHHRGSSDLYVAGIQTWFSPFADIPYYLLSFVYLPNHPRLVAAIAGLPFGALIFATIQLARAVLSDFQFDSPRMRHIIVGLSVLVAVTGVATWSQTTSTSLEVALGVLIVAAMTLLLRAFRASSRGLTWGASLAIGALLGLAAGLKLTAVIYAPAAGLILLAGCGRDWHRMLRCGAAYGLAWIGLFLVTWGPWGWHLYEQTRDPFFPMFTNVFHTPYAAPAGGRDLRAMPQDVSHWLFYPFYWLEVRAQRTVFPFPFRDARYALGYVLGIAIVVHACIRRWRRAAPANKPLVALVGFWFMAYATWLRLFSLLRYAVILEIGASLIAIGAVVLVTRSMTRSRMARFRIPVLIAFTAFIVGFAKIPDLGHVPFGNRTYAADAPSLPTGALVILANRPMGILAPLLSQANPTSTFIGMPTCFADGRWCNQRYYDYELGREMRRKIAEHRGPIYVARYANRRPSMPQLAEFGIRVDDRGCSTMRTNRTANVMVCPASFDASRIGSEPRRQPVRLALQTQTMRDDVRVTGTWVNNPCTDAARIATLTLTWHMPAEAKRVSVFLEEPPSPTRKLFVKGDTAGSATTGNWVRAAQKFIFEDTHGNTLAISRVRYTACAAPSDAKGKAPAQTR